MAGDRNLAIDIWTRAGLVACRYETRLLFVAMQNFADDHGVQPFVPSAIRLQVFPADADMDDARVRSMIEELVSNKLLGTYEVEGQEYVAVVDWSTLQRVRKRARRKYPADPSAPQPEPVAEPAAAPIAEAVSSELSELSRWRRSVARSLRHFMPHTGAPHDTEAWIERWMADGCDLRCDVLPAISVACRPSPDGEGPPGLAAVAAYAEANRVRRLAVASVSLAA